MYSQQPRMFSHNSPVIEESGHPSFGQEASVVFRQIGVRIEVVVAGVTAAGSV
jgi:hypothetical protein